MARRKNESGIPSVLSFEKKLVFSDGCLYGTTWENRYETKIPLKIQEKVIRGTISNRLKDAVINDPEKLNCKIEYANIQTVDSCSLPIELDTLKMEFTLKVLSGIENPFSCNSLEFKNKYKKLIKNYIEKYHFKELSRRYVQNILNARSLWRNRLGAEQIEVVVTIPDEETTLKEDAYDFSFNDFDFGITDNKIDILENSIASTLSGKNLFSLIKVEIFAQIGNGQEVYPSQELVFVKEFAKSDDNKKSKFLYSSNGIAALHSQKIGNAIRTIDTWYPAYNSSNGVGPIAVEVYGSVTNLGTAFRIPKEKTDFYSLFDRYVLGEKLEENEEHFIMAILIRGGLFGKTGDDI